MKTLLDIYNEDPILADMFLDSMNMQVSMIIKGLSLQVYFNEETKKYEYHTHSKEIAIGPKISRLTKLFCKDITDAIAMLEQKQDIVNQYRFLNFLIYDRQLFLISYMLINDTKIINDNSSLVTVASQLQCQPAPILWEGRLSKDQQSTIRNMLIANNNIDSTEFKDRFATLFGGSFQKDPMQNFYGITALKEIDKIPGVIFNVNFGDKMASYKIEDPQYAQLRKEEKARKELDKAQHKAEYERLVRCFVDWFELKAKKLDDSHIKSMQLNFAEMCANTKVLMKLIQVAAQLPVRTNPQFMLQVSMLDEKLKALIRKHGTPMRTLIEQFLLTFYKHKSTWQYDKELIKKMDKIIDIF